MAQTTQPTVSTVVVAVSDGTATRTWMLPDGSMAIHEVVAAAAATVNPVVQTTG